MGIIVKVGCLALSLAGVAAQAQTAPAPDTNINLLGRTFITPEALAASAAPTVPATPVSPTAAAGAAQAADGSRPLSPAAQQILDKFNAGANGKAGAAVNARGKPVAAAPAAPAAAEPVPAPAAAAPVPEAFQRYIPDTDANSGRIEYYQAKGDKKDSYYSQRYAESAPALSNAASDSKQLARLAPYILQLKKAGIDQGKIDVELNRLTPAQFAHWAAVVGN